uniref:Uncharacterized protein n=1 Tax=Denticeps clupeoides TaxID=299321 RepID=A0AAY4CDP3_9TELE
INSDFPYESHEFEFGSPRIFAFQSLLDAQSIRVLVVSFGCQEGAQFWLQQTGCKFEMLLDPLREIYKAFGLGCSYAKVLKFGCMLQYSEYLVLKRELPQVPPQFIDDVYQLGGDFLLNEDGKVIFSHCSKSPIDRPKMTDLLAAISEGSS